jgi:hypothetical protein
MVPSESDDPRPSSVTADRRWTVLSAPAFATGGRLTMVTVVASGAEAFGNEGAISVAQKT